MEFEILYYYDFWNNREEIQLYNQLFHTGYTWKGLLIGERLHIMNDTHNMATAVISEIKVIARDVTIVKTARSVMIIRTIKVK